ncbi:MAG: hypothetical protein IAG13_38245 [Deltaproteobacteria bacterium]|nr:hypothetical protein [Nannocystaceae bacterium]
MIHANLLVQLTVLLVVGCTACSDLASVPSQRCGNLVVEDGEQCDGQPGCGTDGPAVCRFTCAAPESTCPGELACSAQGVCVASASKFVPYALSPRYDFLADRVVVGDLDGDHFDDILGLGASLRVRYGASDQPLLTSTEKRIRPPTGAATFGQLDGRPGLDVVFPTADGVFTLVARGRELDAVPYASAQELPRDTASDCVSSTGWAACKRADVDRDGREDRIGYVAGRDNLEIELGRASGPPTRVTLDTLDVVTDLATGDFDGDGFDDLAYATRSVDDIASQEVRVVYGAPQPQQFTTTLVTTADGIAGIATTDVAPADGLADLAVERTGGSAGVAVFLGDSARDLSSPFQLQSPDRSGADVAFAVVAGDFVGGKGNGIDVMAYARNTADPSRTFLWWLRGLGQAQLRLEIVDSVETSQLSFVETAWQVGDLVTDLSVANNGPDEVIDLASVRGCPGPALTVAVPSARNTGSDLLRSTCLDVEGEGWTPGFLGLVRNTQTRRAVALARRDATWWMGEASRLDEATTSGRLAGTTAMLGGSCRDPQLWSQTPDVATVLSWVCDGPEGAQLMAVRRAVGGSEPASPTPLVSVPAGASHLVGDFNGDGLSDLVVREGSQITVILQCSADMTNTPGC